VLSTKYASGHRVAVSSVLDSIGDTPLVLVDGIYCKLEYLNPSGSIKARIAKNRVWLGPEILSQLPEGRIPDALVMGVGTGGTLVGVGQAFREVNRDVKLFAMEPSESATILCGEVGEHLIEGIADGFVPGIFQRHQRLVDTTLTVDSSEAVESMKELARRYGLFVGPSSGANMIAARKVRESYPELETVVTLFCDEGEKYIADHFAEEVEVTSETYT
jgi:cysteine synthase A